MSWMTAATIVLSVLSVVISAYSIRTARETARLSRRTTELRPDGGDDCRPPTHHDRSDRGECEVSEILAQNHRILLHEIKTPWRGHDGACCLKARLGVADSAQGDDRGEVAPESTEALNGPQNRREGPR